MASDLYIAFGADTGEMEAGLARAQAAVRATAAEMRSLASEMVKTGPSADSEMGSRLASLGSKLSEAKESVASFKDEGRTPSKVVAALPLAPSPEPRRSWWRRLAG
jgi:hypothetical protein